MQILTQKILKEKLIYNPVSGRFTWVKSNSRSKGAISGWQEPGRYTRVNIAGKLYYAHRLAFLYMTGVFPVADIDHINGNKSDNRWGNLRQATRSQNLVHRRVRKDNVLGIKGVAFAKDRSKFRAKVWENGKTKYIGQFDTVELAEACYQKHASTMHGEFYHI